MTKPTTEDLIDQLQQPIDADRLTDTAGKFLYGDLRDWLLGQIKGLPKPWAKLNETEQRRIIEGASQIARDTVMKAVEIVAAGGRQVIPASLDAITVKDGIKATLTVGRHDEMRHELIDSQGARVLLLIAEARPYLHAEKPAKPDPDQGALIDPETGEVLPAGHPASEAGPGEAAGVCPACNRPDSDVEGRELCPGFKGEPCVHKPAAAQKPATWVPSAPQAELTGGTAATGDGGEGRGAGVASAPEKKRRTRKAA